MAGGQSASFGQGSVASQEGEVPLAGTLLSGSQGFIDLPVDEAIAGEESTFGQASKPDYAHTHFIRLRSRKAGGGGTATLNLFGSETLPFYGFVSPTVAPTLLGSAIASTQGSVSKNRFSLVSGQFVQPGTGLMVGNTPSSGTWVVGPISVAQGQSGLTAGQFNVAGTGPNGYLLGGTYDAIGGTALPSGVTLSAAGVLDVGSSTATSITGVVFGYNEPNGLPILTLHPQSTLASPAPYSAGVYPIEGFVPTGSFLTSSDDPTLRSSTLSTWPDGSAKVMVVTGHKTTSANVTQTVALRINNATEAAGSVLTTAFIDSLLTDVTVNFGTPLSITNFTSGYDKIWWANAQTICARYRIPITNLGVMEAVIDVHAYAAGRAFVEVVIENGNQNFAASSVPLAANQSYSAATVSVNGAGLNGAGTSSTYTCRDENGTVITRTVHHGTRAWYCSGWVGGDPLIEVTHDTASMQKHPAFHQFARTATLNMQTFIPNLGSFEGGGASGVQYQNSVYTPWASCYQRSYAMGRGSDEGVTIGHFTQWDSFYLMTGSKYTRRASIANALAMHSYPINNRDSTTHLVPTHTQGGTKNWGANANWPRPTGTSSITPNWDMAHHPATGLVAFMCRPSPCFIELAQKTAMMNAAFTSTTGCTGPFGFFAQTRGKGWGMRSLAHAIFLTPDGDGWKSPAQDSVTTNMNYLNTWLTVQNPLQIVWDYSPTQVFDHTIQTTVRGFQFAMWMFGYLSVGVHKTAVMKVAKTANQALVDQVADWMNLYPIRYVNEAAGGEWRYHKLKYTIGTFEVTVDADVTGNPLSLPTWAENSAYSMDDGPPVEAGTFIDDPLGPPRTSYAQSFAPVPTYNVGDYTQNFWAQFCIAVERGLPGADAAWARVNAGITPSLSSFLEGVTTSIKPRDALYPRNK